MRTICIMNHKGGVGKTTTAVNLAAGLSRQNKKVLLIDFDPQGNVDTSLRVEPDYTLYDALTGKVALERCIITLATNFDVISSKENLVKAEHYLSNQSTSKNLLREILGKIKGYDYMLVDCPPALGVLNQNVLAFCDEVIVPTSTDFLGFDALCKMEKVIDTINNSYDHNIVISKIVPTLFDKRNRICKETLKEMNEKFPGKVSEPIRSNSKLKEAPKYGKSIFKYARSSPGAKDYGALVESVLSMSVMPELVVE